LRDIRDFQQYARSSEGRVQEIAMNAANAPHRVPARELVTPERLARLRDPVEWTSIGLIAHAWAVIFGAMALVAVLPNPLTYLLAVMLIGSRQLGLAILMHEGAHRCFSRNESRNMALSQWLCAYPIFADTQAYRRYHLQHHAHTQQKDDPDLALSAPFPITKASYRRKFLRDITGRTGYQQRKAQFFNALGDPSWPLAKRARCFRERLGNQVAVNSLLWAGLALAGVWWAYPLLWLVPLLTWMMVITRIRNIAEHAVVPNSNDPLRNTRTTKANLLERAFIAPYFVNYHLEHHLLFYVPCYSLPKLHDILMRGPHAAQMEVQRGYLSVLRLVTTKPDVEDRPGDIVRNARRKSGDNRVGQDRASAGF
jgi:fatty acid desaturase